MVPWPPGGGVDTTARIIAEPLGERLGRPSSSTTAGRGRQHRHRAGGARQARRLQPADGLDQPERGQHAPLLASSASIRSRTSRRSCYVSAVPNILVVPANSPFKTVKDLIDAGAREPGQAELRLGRRRLLAAPGGGASDRRGQDRHRPRALQGHGAGRGRPGRGPRLADARHHHLPAVHRRRQDARAGGRLEDSATRRCPNVPTFDEVGRARRVLRRRGTA